MKTDQFCNHMELHRSKTESEQKRPYNRFCNHMELHRSKTRVLFVLKKQVFCNHMELHRSKTETVGQFTGLSFVTIWNYTVLKPQIEYKTTDL